MLNQQLQFFKQYFRQSLDNLNNDYWRQFAVKKYSHSIRVLRFGTQLLNAEPLLRNLSPTMRRLAETALLFHDIGRFREALVMAEQNSGVISGSWFRQKFDHGAVGAEILADYPPYNDPRLILPLRHHGHLIEALHSDSDYLSLSETQRQEVDIIIAVVRDADKLDNFYINKYHDSFHHEPFFISSSDEVKYAPVSPPVLEAFVNRRAVKTSAVNSLSDRIICTLAWIFDMNYRSAFQIIAEEQYQQTFYRELENYCADPEIRRQVQFIFESVLSEKLV